MTTTEFDYIEYDHWIDEFAYKIDILNGRIEKSFLSLGLDCTDFFRTKSSSSPPILNFWDKADKVWSLKVRKDSNLARRIEALIDVENPEIELFNIGTEQVLKVLE